MQKMILIKYNVYFENELLCKFLQNRILFIKILYI